MNAIKDKTALKLAPLQQGHSDNKEVATLVRAVKPGTYSTTLPIRGLNLFVFRGISTEVTSTQYKLSVSSMSQRDISIKSEISARISSRVKKVDAMRDLFTLSGYRTFFSKLSEQISIFPFSQLKKDAGLILRHDIDVDVEAAYRLAQVEYEAGVRSTFFFLTNCPTYNILSLENKNRLRKMSEQGFEVALHFDPTVYQDQSQGSLQRMVEFEAQIIESVTGEKVRSVSLHNPSVHNTYPEFDGYINAYHKDYFGEGRYLSDSRMLYRSSPEDFCLGAKDELRQLLIHPIHVTEDGNSYPHPIKEFAERFVDQMDQSFRINSEYARLTEGDLRDYLWQKKETQ